MSRPELPDDPRETVLQALGRLTGEEPRVRLRDAEPADASTAHAGVVAPGPENLAAGRGNYQLLGEIARGGMGVVLKGHDTDLGRDVAVKVLSERLVDTPGVLQRFVEEAQIGGQLQHPGVVPIYELGMMEGERPYFAMKLVKGRTLADLLAEREGPDDDRARFLSIFEAVCQTIAYAHSKGVLHRDLKPANIMVGAFGEVQVVDWGLAKVLTNDASAAEESDRTEDATVIQTVRSGSGSGESASMVGSVLGTPAYMPPEQAIGDLEHVDERSDVFALGAILLEVLTGAPPYVAGEGERLVLLAARAELEPARRRLEACAADPELKELVLDCLAPASESRPRDAGRVASRIREFLSSLEEKAHRAELAATEARELRRRQRLALVLGATVVAAVIVIGLVLRSMERQREGLQLERVAAALEELDAAADEITEHLDAGRRDAALAAAREALESVESRDLGDPPMTARAAGLLARTEKRAEELRRRQELEARNAALLGSLDRLRPRLIDSLVTFGATVLTEDLDAAYGTAFREYGLDLDEVDPGDALETLRENRIGVELAHGLDDWAGLRRQLHGPRSPEVEVVTTLALDLDPDAVRTRLREALLADDEQAVLAFLREEDLGALSAATVWSLSEALRSFEHHEPCFLVVRDAVVRHPEDFLLNMRAGQLYGERGAYVAAMSFLSAARGVRPDSAAAHVLLGESLRVAGYLPRALFVYAEALRLNPEYTEVRNSMAWLQMVLGDYPGAADSYGWLSERFPEVAVYDFRELLARFLMGEASRAEVVERLEGDARLRGRGQAAGVWALCFHPDPAQRDPARVIAIQDSWGHEEPATEATEAAALLQLGRPAEALAALDHGESMLGAGAVSVVVATSGKLRAEYAVYRARAYHDLGDDVRAGQYLDAAAEIMREFMFDGYEPWAASPLVRLFRETEGLLGR